MFTRSLFTDTSIFFDSAIRSSTGHTLTTQVRLLPDLRYSVNYEATNPAEEIIGWAFVESCDQGNINQNSEQTELGVDSRSTLTIG